MPCFKYCGCCCKPQAYLCCLCAFCSTCCRCCPPLKPLPPPFDLEPLPPLPCLGVSPPPITVIKERIYCPAPTPVQRCCRKPTNSDMTFLRCPGLCQYQYPPTLTPYSIPQYQYQDIFLSNNNSNCQNRENCFKSNLSFGTATTSCDSCNYPGAECYFIKPLPKNVRIHRAGVPILPGYRGHVPGLKYHGAARTFGQATKDTCCIMSKWEDCCPQYPCRIFEQ